MDAKFEIRGQDFKRAGEASFEVKSRLKRLGLPPEVIRRVATAAYEAEMNVIVYAEKGVMRLGIGEQCIDVTVSDVGPGIPDIPLAMQEGYTTAPPFVKQMGYGHGMGLPNIKKNADWLEIQSDVNRGTTLRFKVQFNEGKKGGE